MKRTYCFIVVVSIFACIYSSSITNHMNFRHYRTSDGLGGNYILDIIQSSSGHMWFANSGGLSSFDGYKFKNYYPQSLSFKSLNSITCVIEIEDNKLLVGTENGVLIFNPETESFSAIDAKTINGTEVNSTITSIIIDNHKNYWYSTIDQGIFKYIPTTRELIHYLYIDEFHSEKFNNVRCIFQDSQGDIWAGTLDQGTFRMKVETSEFKQYNNTGDNASEIGDNYIETIFEDSFGNLWFGTYNNGISLYKRESDSFIHFFDGKDKVRLTQIHDINEYDPGELIITSNNGLTVFDVNNKQSFTLMPDMNNPKHSLSERFTYATCVDREKGLWIGTYYGGVNYCSPKDSFFECYRNNLYAPSVNGNVISSFVEDGTGKIWIGSDDGGVSWFDPNNGKFNYPNNEFKKLPFLDKNVHAILADDDKIWIGTYATGLFVYNLNSGKTKHYTKSKLDNSIVGNSIYSLAKSTNGLIWIGTTEGLCYYDSAEDSFTTIKEFDNTYINKIIPDKRGYLWVSTYGKGLFMLNFKDNKWTNFKANSENSIISDRITSITLDEKNILWIIANGLTSFSFDTNEFTQHPHINNYEAALSSIVFDNGLLWITSDKGIIRYDLNSSNSKIYRESDGLISENFCVNSSLQHSDGMIYFGSTNGFCRFNPKDIRDNKYIPETIITGLQVANKNININDSNTIINKSIEYTDFIQLKNRQSIVSFEFAALSYINPEQNKYVYKLEGLESEWNYTSSNKVSYTNLGPGKYKFVVRGSNNDNIWSANNAGIDVIVKPPLLLSNLAIALYILFGLLCLTILILNLKRIAKKKNREKIEKIENEKEHEIYEAKIKFFRYVTHEIRTPLSLITGPVEYIISNYKLNKNVRGDLEIIQRNSNRLLNLVNQLLDFRKIETEFTSIQITSLDIIKVVKDACEYFNHTFKIKNIEFHFYSDSDSFIINSDNEAITKVITNILSNAVKFTESKIELSINTNTNSQFTELIVRDNGGGINEVDMEKIFQPFFQVSTMKITDTPGTGLGLHLSKSLLNLIDGSITINPNYKEGAEFIIHIPSLSLKRVDCSDNDFKLNVLDISDENQELSDLPVNDSKSVVLIVEDNYELRLYLKKIIDQKYSSIIVADGAEAIDAIKNNHIDMIITDIVMPNVDGFEVCKFIKSNVNYSHIPVIMLTANATPDYKLKSLEFGADAYVVKPFNNKVLIAQVDNIFKNREKIRQIFIDSPLGAYQSATNNTADDAFLEKLNKTIIDNIDNQDFLVDDLVITLNMSRSSLFVKIKAISGLTPNDYINLIRLKRAATLLSSNQYRINEVSFLVGFSSPSYFSRCFQKQFKMLPSEFVKNLKEMV